MDEGTSPQNPGYGVPGSQGMSQNIPGSSQPVPPADPVVYKTQQVQKAMGGMGGGGKVPHFPLKKLLLSLFGIFLTLIVVAVVVIMFTSDSSPRVDQEQVVLSYWGYLEDEDVMRNVISEFESENPNIKVEYSNPEPDEYLERLQVRSKNGNGPDLFRYHNTWYPLLSDILTPIPEEVVKRDEFESRYYDVIKYDLIQNGAVVGIPLYVDTLTLFVNEDLLIQSATQSADQVRPPETWQGFIDTAKAMTKKDDRGGIEIGGAAIGTYDNIEHAPDIVSLLMAQNGVDLENIEDYETEVAAALKFYTTFSLISDDVWDSTMGNSLDMFVDGRLGMYFGYSWDYNEIKTRNPNLNVIVASVPQLIRDNPISIASYWVEGVSSYSSHPEEALLLMTFLAKPETQEKLYQEAMKKREIGQPYSIATFIDRLQGTSAFNFADQARFAVSTPFVGGLNENELNSTANEGLKTAINDTISRRGNSEEAVEGLFNSYSNATSIIGNFVPGQ